MPIRPRLVRSIPFWGLVAASLATAAAGAYILTDKLGSMTTTLTDGTATTVDVYVGQSVAVVGAVVLGAGVVGLLLALAIAAAATLRPHPPVEVVEPIDWTDESDESDEEPAAGDGYERGLGYTDAIDTAPAVATAPADDSAPADERRAEASAPR